MTKGEKNVLDHLLSELMSHRKDVQKHGVVLARLDERTIAIQRRIDGVEARVNRRSSAIAAIVAVIVGVGLTFALNAMGYPRG